MKNKNLFILIAVTLGYIILFAVLYMFYRDFKTEGSVKGDILYKQEELLPPLYSGDTVSQTITLDGEKETVGIAFFFQGYQSDTEGDLIAEIIDLESGEILFSSKTPFNEILDKKYYEFPLTNATSANNVRVSFEVRSNTEDKISIWKNLSYKENKLYVDDIEIAGGLSYYEIYKFAPVTLSSFALFYFVFTLPFYLVVFFKWNPWTSVWDDISKVQWIDVLLVVTILIFCYFSFNHLDLQATMDQGKDFLIALENGDLFKFYQYAQQDEYTFVGANYMLPTYILFGLWNIPVQILFKVKGLPFETTSVLYATSLKILWWNKLLPVLFFLASAYVLYKIGLQLKFSREKAKWMTFLLVSSPIAIYSQFIFGQYDSMGLLFTLIAFLYYFRKDLTKFSIFIAIAMTFKAIPLFMFVPLLLFSEKRVRYLLKYLIIGASGILFFNLLFLGDPYYIQSTQLLNKWTEYLFGTGIPTDMGTLSIFPIGIALISIWAYTMKTEDEETFIKRSVYIALAAFSLLFSFSDWHPQWLLYLVPFLAIAEFQFDKFRVSMYLDIVASILFFGLTIVRFPQLDDNLLAMGVFPRILGWNNFGYVKDVYLLFGRLPEGFYVSMFAAVLLSNLVIKFPCNNRSSQNKMVNYLDQRIGGENDGENIEREVIWFRLLSVMEFIIPVLVIYLFRN